MAGANNEFQIVGRYLDGKTVTAYHLQSLGSGKAGKFSKEHVAYLIGKELITNCTAQIYKGKLLLRGKGMSLDDLPAKQENGELKNTEGIGKIKKDATTGDVMEQLMIVGALRSGRKTVGYIVQNAGCGTARLSRKKVLDMAEQGKIGNARVQNYKGDKLLRGVGINLDELPSEEVIVENENETAGRKSKTVSQDKLTATINNYVTPGDTFKLVSRFNDTKSGDVDNLNLVIENIDNGKKIIVSHMAAVKLVQEGKIPNVELDHLRDRDEIHNKYLTKLPRETKVPDDLSDTLIVTGDLNRMVNVRLHKIANCSNLIRAGKRLESSSEFDGNKFSVKAYIDQMFKVRKGDLIKYYSTKINVEIGDEIKIYLKLYDSDTAETIAEISKQVPASCNMFTFGIYKDLDLIFNQVISDIRDWKARNNITRA